MAIVTHFHGGQDNSGGTADNVVDLGAGWQDNYIEEDNPDTNRGTSFSVAVAKGTNTSQFSPEGHQQFAMISFGNLLKTTLGTDTINSATLSLNIESWNGTNTFHIYGYSGTTAVNSMTYNNAFSGINSAVSYGTFSTPSATGAFQLDITSALQAYVRGDIDAIAIGTAEREGTGSSRSTFRFTSNDLPAVLGTTQPSLSVNHGVPEPGAYALILGTIGMGFVLIRRNRRKAA